MNPVYPTSTHTPHPTTRPTTTPTPPTTTATTSWGGGIMKMLSAKRLSCCLGLNVLKRIDTDLVHTTVWRSMTRWCSRRQLLQTRDHRYPCTTAMGARLLHHQPEGKIRGYQLIHYSDVIMGPMASLITSLESVYLTVYSGADQRKHQSSTSLAFVRGINRLPVTSPHKWPVTQKMFPFYDVIMCLNFKQL